MRFDNWQQPKIEHGKLTKWNWMVHHPDNLMLGKNTDIGSFSYLNAKHQIEIGDEVQIGSHCSLYTISTIDNKQGKITIMKNAKIGSHSTVMPGVTIGENSVIGAHSFVNKDIPANVVAYGVPAKIARTIEISGEEKPWQVTESEQVIGGQTGRQWKVPLFKVYWDEYDVRAVSEVIRRGTYWANGPEIRQFENRIAEFVGVKHALAFNSGTSALHTLLATYDIKDKEVIVPSFTFIATANAIVLAGGIPVFAEIESQTFGLNAKDVQKRITEKTKAIMVVHYSGFPARDTELLRRIADEHNLLFIEDAAESLGANIGGKKVGSFGHAAIFSFCQNKVISTGEGGALVTNDGALYERARLIRSHGRVELSDENYFSFMADSDYLEAGYNFRMPSTCAALGLSQFNKIYKVIQLRREKASYLRKNLSGIREITFPAEIENHFQVYQMFAIKLNDLKTRDELQQFLSEKGIMSKVYFNPVHLKTIYTKSYGYKEGDLPKTELLSSRVLNVPLYPTILKEEMDYLVEAIRGFFKK